MRPLALACLFVPLLAAHGAAQLLQPGRLLVACEGDDEVHVFGPGGGPIDTFAGPTRLSAPNDLAWGPDGRLYVVSPDSLEVVVFDSEGVEQDAFPLAADSRGVALGFGADGELWVLDDASDQLLSFDMAGVPGASVPVPAEDYPQTSLVFSVDGRILLSSATSDAVLELDLATGAVIRLLGDGQLTSPRGLAFGPDGRLHVCEATDVAVLDAEGEVVDTLSDAAFEDLRGLAFGPDGRLYVADGGADVVHVLTDGVATDTLGGATLSAPTALAFAPFRYQATVKGRIARENHALGKVKESSVVLTLLAGSRTVMLALTDDITEPSDLASVFGSTALVFRGFEAAEDDVAKLRLWQGTQVGSPAAAAGVASIELQVKGKLAQGQFVPKKTSGTLHRAGATGVYTATVKAGKPLP